MDTVKGLIVEGKKLIEQYDMKKHSITERISGIDYEMWMGKIKAYADTQLKECELGERLNKIYCNKSTSLRTDSIVNVLGILSIVQASMEFKGENKQEKMKEQGMKIFISHSSKDKVYGDVLVELLKDLGLRRNEIIYTSDSRYGIPLGNNIYEYIRSSMDMDIHMIFLLSSNYFESVACLNEMGAAWITRKDHTIIAVPEFDYRLDKYEDCCIDSKKVGLTMDDYVRFTEFREIIEAKFGRRIDNIEWQGVLEKYRNHLEEIKKDYKKLN